MPTEIESPMWAMARHDDVARAADPGAPGVTAMAVSRADATKALLSRPVTRERGRPANCTTEQGSERDAGQAGNCTARASAIIAARITLPSEV